MPNIRTFDNNIRAPQADSAGSQAFEVEGRHVESAYAQAGNAIGGGISEAGKVIEQHEEIQDTSSISSQGAKAFSDLSQSLTKTMSQSDPNKADQTANDWREKVLEESLSNIGADASTIHGQEMAERVRNTLREEFTRQSIGAASTMAGAAVVENMTATKNGLAQAVSNDPSLLPTAMAYLHGTMEDQLAAHNLSPERAAQLHTEFTTQAGKDLGVAAYQTMAQRNPEAAKEALKGGVFAGLFSGEEIGTLNHYADTQAKALVEANKAAETEVRRQQTDAFKQTTSSLFASMIKPDGSLQVPKDLPQAIVKTALMPGAEPGEVRSMINMVKEVNKDQGRANTDPHTYELFNRKMLDGTLTDGDIYQARANGQLSDKDTGYFIRGQKTLAADPVRKEAEKQFNAFLAGQKPAFTHSNLLSGPDPKGADNYFQFSQAARSQFEQAYKDGTWKESLQRGSKNYLGSIAPTYMSNQKGASIQSAPHFTSDQAADAGIAGLKSGMPFYGPDGQLHYKK